MEKFKFRAECLTDVFLFIDYCPAGSIKKIEHNTLEGIENCTDLEVAFESKLSLEELRQICSKIEDGHIILQTIQPFVSYTGERNYDLK